MNEEITEKRVALAWYQRITVGGAWLYIYQSGAIVDNTVYILSFGAYLSWRNMNSFLYIKHKANFISHDLEWLPLERSFL